MNQDNKKQNLRQALLKAQEAFKKFEEEFIKESENAWENLGRRTQLLVFCAVTRRLWQATEEDHSYRGTLYDVFGFDTDSYVAAQISGFLDLHNSYMSTERLKSLREMTQRYTIRALKEKGYLDANLNEEALLAVAEKDYLSTL